MQRNNRSILMVWGIATALLSIASAQSPATAAYPTSRNQAKAPQHKPFSQQSHNYQSGFYLGILEGMSRMGGQAEDTYDYNTPPAFTDKLSASKSLSKNTAFVTEAVLGGRYLCKNGFFPGAELAFSFANDSLVDNFTFQSVQVVATTLQFTSTIKRKRVVTPSLVLGWAFHNNFHIFTKFGLGISSFNTTVLAVQDQNLTQSQTFSKRETKYGFVPALGVEYAFSPRFSVVGTVSYEIYQQLHVRKTDPTSLALTTDVKTLKVNPSVFTQKLGILFKF